MAMPQLIKPIIEDKKYTVRIDEADTNTTYIGEAAFGSAEDSAVWRIKRISVSGTVTSINWADGNTNFNKKWSDRPTLNYS